MGVTVLDRYPVYCVSPAPAESQLGGVAEGWDHDQRLCFFEGCPCLDTLSTCFPSRYFELCVGFMMSWIFFCGVRPVLLEVSCHARFVSVRMADVKRGLIFIPPSTARDHYAFVHVIFRDESCQPFVASIF